MVLAAKYGYGYRLQQVGSSAVGLISHLGVTTDEAALPVWGLDA